MLIIKDPALSKLSTPELRTLADGTITTLSPFAASHPLIDRSLEVVKGSLSAITNINNTPQGSDITEEIRTVDGDMDASLRLAREVMQANVNMAAYNPAKAAASEKLLSVMSKRSSALFSGGYVEQGAEVTDFLSDVFTDELADTREDSGVAPILETIKDQFSQLKELLAARAAEDTAPTTVKEQKQIIRYRLEKLYHYVDINCVDEIDGFTEVITPLNDIITSVMSQYRARETRRQNRDVEEN